MRELTAMVLVAYVWGVWHGLMQTYGFLRIYDAKVGSVARTTARLDMAMCVDLVRRRGSGVAHAHDEAG